MHHQDLEALRDLGDRHEVLHRVVAGAFRHRRDHRERRGVAHQQRVAVGLGLRHFARADGAAGAGAVLDHHRLPELGRKDLRGAGIVGPPAAAATMMRIGLVGPSCWRSIAIDAWRSRRWQSQYAIHGSPRDLRDAGASSTARFDLLAVRSAENDRGQSAQRLSGSRAVPAQLTPRACRSETAASKPSVSRRPSVSIIAFISQTAPAVTSRIDTL